MSLTAGEKIQIIMKRQNKNMTELAESTNQTRQNLSNKMSRDNFTEKDIRAMAKALGCQVDIVFTLPDESKL